jgi:hypothetical protein
VLAGSSDEGGFAEGAGFDRLPLAVSAETGSKLTDVSGAQPPSQQPLKPASTHKI